MDHTNFNTEEIIRKPGKHLTSDERGKIEVMRKLGSFDAKFSSVFKTIEVMRKRGYSCRASAKEIHCSHSTVYYELKRNTPLRIRIIPRYTLLIRTVRANVLKMNVIMAL